MRTKFKKETTTMIGSQVKNKLTSLAPLYNVVEMRTELKTILDILFGSQVKKGLTTKAPSYNNFSNSI
jgi:hypothetical protein